MKSNIIGGKLYIHFRESEIFAKKFVYYAINHYFCTSFR